jgi:hypothetical protein
LALHHSHRHYVNSCLSYSLFINIQGSGTGFHRHVPFHLDVSSSVTSWSSPRPSREFESCLLRRRRALGGFCAAPCNCVLGPRPLRQRAAASGTSVHAVIIFIKQKNKPRGYRL